MLSVPQNYGPVKLVTIQLILFFFFFHIFADVASDNADVANESNVL